LANEDSLDQVIEEIGNVEIDFLVYNAAKPYIGKFESLNLREQTDIARVNVISALRFVHYYGSKMVETKRGAVILMSSLSGQQGSPYISAYAATKAFNQVLGEGLWYEWKSKNVDVMACVAGATSTPNFIQSKPKPLGLFEPQVQTPEAVVKECFNKLGKKPSFITGGGNRLAAFFMNKFFSRKLAVKVMGDSVKRMYGISD
jgi:short-subunit dehydrogenase